MSTANRRVIACYNKPVASVTSPVSCTAARASRVQNGQNTSGHFTCHIAQLEGAVVTGFITDHVTEAWIDFTYCGDQFSVNDQYRVQ